MAGQNYIELAFNCFQNCSLHKKIHKHLSKIQFETGAKLEFIQTIRISGVPHTIQEAQKLIQNSPNICQIISDDIGGSEDVNKISDESFDDLSSSLFLNESLLKMVEIINDKIQTITTELNVLKNEVQVIQDGNQEAITILNSIESKIPNELYTRLLNMGHVLKLDLQITAERIKTSFEQMKKSVYHDNRVLAEMVHKQLQFEISTMKQKQEGAISDDEDVDLDEFYKSKEYIECRKYAGDQLIHTATLLNRLDVVKKLVKNGANVNVKNKFGWTPLQSAADKGYFNIVKYLVEHNASIDDQNHYGQTALIIASIFGHKDIVEYLCSKNASIQLKNVRNKTALDYALQFSETGIKEILQKYIIKTLS